MKDCPKYETEECPNTKKKSWFGCIEKEYLIALISYIVLFTSWVIFSITDLKASYSDINKIAEDVKIIKTCLINGECRTE